MLVGELGEVEETGDAEVEDAVFPRAGHVFVSHLGLHFQGVLVGEEELGEEAGDAVFPRTAASSSTPCSLQPP